MKTKWWLLRASENKMAPKHTYSRIKWSKWHPSAGNASQGNYLCYVFCIRSIWFYVQHMHTKYTVRTRVVTSLHVSIPATGPSLPRHISEIIRGPLRSVPGMFPQKQLSVSSGQCPSCPRSDGHTPTRGGACPRAPSKHLTDSIFSHFFHIRTNCLGTSHGQVLGYLSHT